MTGKLILGLLSTLALSVALLGQNAQETYQQALAKEQANGNLKDAIKLYTQAVKFAGKDRALAAKALIHIAGAQEKLGQQAEAVNAYAEVLQTYPDQREQASLAQTRLDALRQAPLADSQKDVSSVSAPVFQTYCANCHNGTNKAGGLDLGSLNAKNVGENTVMWENVLRRLRARRDPPAGSTRPDDKTYRSMISKLETALDNAYPTNGPLQITARLTDTELATRIASFVWNAAPDAPLLDDARRGKLQDPGVLDRQIVRMLRDPRSSSLISRFFEPWLSLDRLKDQSRKAADADLLQSMQTESRLFLENQLRENHNALELWTANYTYMNEDLARHYGIPNISGKEFRRVTWPDSTRSGILGQAGPLTVTSSTRTSPVSRGVYVFTKFLGMEASPPPANVPPMREDPTGQGGPMRDRLAAHKVNPLCASCHITFDPLGLALENFDAVGKWRTTDGGSPIDASGTFIDGTRFSGPAELRAGLLKYRDAYYTNITQQLLAYALNRSGRGARIYDYEMPSVRSIVRAASSKDYRWSSIISGIVTSSPFQMKNLVP